MRRGSTKRPAFTLLELMVVTAIIALLLAMLMPAIDRAVYAAQMAAEGANLKGSVEGLYSYAANHRSRYPYRAYFDVNQGPNGVELLKVGDNPRWDLRPVLRPYLPMKNLLDPFSAHINYDTLDPDGNIQCNYSLWFDYGVFGSSRMSRVGSRFTWLGDSFSVLIGDFDLVVPVSGAVFNGHADEKGVMSFVVGENLTEFGLPGAVAGPQGRKWSYSRWQRWSDGEWRRGPVDQQYGYQDGSVRRYDGMSNGQTGVSEDSRMVKVPPRPYATETASYWSYLPRE